jgi:hypothetical protein
MRYKTRHNEYVVLTTNSFVVSLSYVKNTPPHLTNKNQYLNIFNSRKFVNTRQTHCVVPLYAFIDSISEAHCHAVIRTLQRDTKAPLGID